MSSVASLIHRFRTAPPTATNERAAVAPTWYQSSPQRPGRYSEEDQTLQALEQSVRLSRDLPPPQSSSGPSGSIDDLIAADVRAARGSMQPSIADPAALNPPPASTFQSPRSPEEVRQSRKAVPRFRFQPGKALNPSRPAYGREAEGYDFESSSDDDSYEEPVARSTKGVGGGFGDSLRLATFRGGESSDSDDTEAYAKRRGKGRKGGKENEGRFANRDLDSDDEEVTIRFFVTRLSTL
jgi:hypothetical protein